MNFHKHLQWAVFTTVLINAAAMFSPIINSGDAVTYATIANHIVLSHDWVKLVLDGHDWLDKPHLPFWITAFFFKLGGSGAPTYILPGFIFHLVGAYYTYRLARLLYNKQTAGLAVLIYVSIFNLMDASIEVKAETYLIGQIMPACYYWLRYDTKFRIKYLVLGALFTAMAVMTKGIFTLFTITSGMACLWIYQKQWSKFFSLKWLAALILSLLFVAPELIALHMQFNRHDGNAGLEQPVSSIRFFFWDSQFGRFFNTGPIQNHNGNPFYFVLVFLWAFLPWTIIFFAAIHAQVKSFGKSILPERAAFIFLSGAFLCTFLMFSATKFQFDYYIDIILPFAAILCAQYLNKSSISRTLFITQMSLICLLALIAIAMAIYVMNIELLAAAALILIWLMYYAYKTRAALPGFRILMYSVLAINLLYIFLTLLTAVTFMQYSVAYNAAKLFGRQSAVPIYVFQMPEVARELALYSEAPCYEIDNTEALIQAKGSYYLIARRGQEQQFHLDASRLKQIASMELVVHKTGTFNKLLRLAKGVWPLESIDFLKLSAP
ncbi:MAG: Glycosyl transferase family 39 [Candidatus Gallionella acididurans]|uniref:Glycosyl transferase family 39 n=1 Tax=Candidatus Gallionella acididurans TaxID=1796491 RepID=A0A139BR41_9PROT|nr:MAG: Glycosyl transferase family 39 [Candidatus Gallionella acididurans]